MMTSTPTIARAFAEPAVTEEPASQSTRNVTKPRKILISIRISNRCTAAPAAAANTLRGPADQWPCAPRKSAPPATTMLRAAARSTNMMRRDANTSAARDRFVDLDFDSDVEEETCAARLCGERDACGAAAPRPADCGRGRRRGAARRRRRAGAFVWQWQRRRCAGGGQGRQRPGQGQARKSGRHDRAEAGQQGLRRGQGYRRRGRGSGPGKAGDDVRRARRHGGRQRTCRCAARREPMRCRRQAMLCRG